ncbi:gastrula zinc finger protein XlCGF57.1-like isoform X2 [Drosophila subobscura]|uniref:gastrula zinc finger protein XlCGF57.1-like isoform X2 n=1 Tax=Drosophila subobscura TaxID=7241 RepID=UPI00155A37DE|nr:gastrula zinc finger protein XlCGF57.1-like isoform X2 [Drosophila subobscura]
MKGLDRCRVCSCTTECKKEAYNLLELPEVAAMFTACTDLLVDPREEDFLPSELCSCCYEELQKCHTFRELCIKADTSWRLLKGLSEKEFDDVDDMPLCTLECTKSPGPPIEATELVLVDGRFREEKPCQRLKKENKEKVKTKAGKRTKAKAKEVPPTKEQGVGCKCETCSKEFVDESRLQAHMREHDGHLLFPCTEPGCDKSFSRLQDLNVHLREHDGTGTWYTCDQEGCSKSYRHKGTLVMHKRQSHSIGPKLKLHVCEFCGRVLKSLAALNHHRFTHKDKLVKPYACEEPGCSVRFLSEEKLKVHMMRHRGIKNFTCPHCGAKKTTKNELKLHINYHTLERTWPCPHCPKVCNSSTSRKMHIRTNHEKTKSYACSICDKRFTKPDTRKYHELTHTGERNFGCAVCGKRFVQPTALRTHRKIHERDQAKTPPGV